MKLMMPFIPHLAHECLNLHNCENIDKWPKIYKKNQNEIKIAIQINGKTRDIIQVKKDIEEKELTDFIVKNSKANKFIINNKILKTIYVKNRILNFIIKN